MRAALLSLALLAACAPAPAVAPGPATATTPSTSTSQAAAAAPSASVSAAGEAASAPASASSGGASSPSPPPSDCGMSASLVARGWRRELTPTSAVEAPAFAAGTTTLAVLPDTQYYASCASPHFPAQARWLSEQAKARRIRGVITLGDLTDHNTPAEWQYIRDGVKLIEDTTPFVLVTGNHDVGDGGTANHRKSLLSTISRRRLASPSRCWRSSRGRVVSRMRITACRSSG